MHIRYFEQKIHSADPTAPLGSPNNPSMAVFTVANVVTVSRIALTVVFFFLFINHVNRIACLVIYAVAALTDFLDGQIARATQTVSWVGKLLDPVVDRMLLFTGVVALCWVGELPLWIPILIIGRDVYLGAGMLALRSVRRRPLDVLFMGKLTTALLLLGFCLCLWGAPVLDGLHVVSVAWLPLLNGQSGALGLLFVYAGCVCTIITALMYTIEGVQLKLEADEGRLEKPQPIKPGQEDL